MSLQVLLIEDDVRFAQLLQRFLQDHAIILKFCHSARDAVRLLREQSYDLILLDIMLPDGDGLEIIKRIRSDSAVPVIMITARGADEDKIIGLELGADDYLAKPFNPRELVARIKAVLRRNSPSISESASIEYEDFSLNPATQKVLIYGKEVELTSSEFRFLKLLCSNPGRVFTRERLMDLVQGREFDGLDRSVDVHVSRLRNKIEQDPKKPRWIQTVWGTGYRFNV